MLRHIFTGCFLWFFSLLIAVPGAFAQGSSGSINGTVSDPSGALVSGAADQISNPDRGYTRAATSDESGHFQFFNIPFNPYRLTITQAGFQTSARST